MRVFFPKKTSSGLFISGRGRTRKSGANALLFNDLLNLIKRETFFSVFLAVKRGQRERERETDREGGSDRPAAFCHPDLTALISIRRLTNDSNN